MKNLWRTTAMALLLTGNVQAAETEGQTSLSIYNNTGLVRDVRSFNLPQGRSSVLFSGVARQMKPESAILTADGVTVKEQNYDYYMLSPQNMAEANIGKIVKTAMWDEKQGKDVYGKAKIIDIYGGRPVLQFSYGIEFDFPGRILWSEIPEGMVSKPSLSLDVETASSGDKNLSLMYLTDGLQWSANYVAELVSDSELNLKSWVSINNNSGADYKNAQVQLVAGTANITSYARPVMLRSNMMMKSMAAGASMDMDGAVVETASIAGEEASDFYIYRLPEKISLSDNQTKQISLLSKDNIKVKKEYRLTSPLFLGLHASENSFKQQNSEIVFTLVNDAKSNLGEPLPKGVIRFYDKDKGGNVIFLGEAAFKQLAVGEETELKTGRSFDLTASGKIVNLTKIAENTVELEANISFKNAKAQKTDVVFEQRMYDSWTIVSENIQSTKPEANKAQWIIDVPAQGTAMLNFKVRFVKVND